MNLASRCGLIVAVWLIGLPAVAQVYSPGPYPPGPAGPGAYGGASYPGGGTPALPYGAATPSESTAWPPAGNSSAWPPAGQNMPLTPATQPVYPIYRGNPAYQPSAPGVPPPYSGETVYPAIMPGQGLAAQPVMPAPTPLEKLVQSSWYTRVDYFRWNERSDGTDFVNERGALYTVGYTRKIGLERFRAELFGADVHYEGYSQSGDGSLNPLSSSTRYLGCRGEYELVFEPPFFDGQGAIVLGIGSRLWVRDLRSGIDNTNSFVSGYQETWWTTYPYLGLEGRRSLGSGWEFYSQARVGATVATVSYATVMDEPIWPKYGVTAQAEIGLRGERCFVSADCEVMTWARSSEVNYWDSVAGGPGMAWQPTSVMFTVGGRLGVNF